MTKANWLVVYSNNTGTQIEIFHKTLHEARTFAFNKAKLSDTKVYLTYILEEIEHDKT